MPSIGEALRALEIALFVGRSREIEIFQRWFEASFDSLEVLSDPESGKWTPDDATAAPAAGSRP